MQGGAIVNLETLYRENHHIVRGYVLSLCGDEHLPTTLPRKHF